MAIKCSKGFSKALAETGSIADIFNLGKIRVYSASSVSGNVDGVPPTAEAATTGATVIWEITSTANPVSGITFEPVASGSRSLLKLAAATWGGTALDTPAAVFFRIVGSATDDNSASDTLPRIQGTVGVVGSGADFIVASTTFVAGTKNLSAFSITVPE